MRSWLVARHIVPESAPMRIIAAASFVNMLGTAMFNVGAVIFYTQVVGLSVAQVGLGMGLAIVVGTSAGIPAGRLADRRGPREVYLLTLTAQMLAMTGLVLVRSFWLFVVLVTLTMLAQSASQAARGPVVRRFAGEKPARFRAYLRSTAMLAGSIGSLMAGLAIQLNTHTIYTCLILANALSFLASAALVSRLPRLAPLDEPADSIRWAGLRDIPFFVVTLLDGLMTMQGMVLTFALPLWIVDHTHAPRWFVGVTLAINTAMVVLLQVRSSRAVETNAGAVRSWRRSGFAFLAGMGLIGMAGGLPVWVAVVLIVTGILVYTVGEIWQAAGAFELRYNLVPAHAQGQYSGVSLLGGNLTGAVAPSVVGLFCLSWGMPGWWLLGGAFVIVGLAVPFVVRWAERTRPAGMAAAGATA